MLLRFHAGVNLMKEQTEVGKLKEGRYMVIDDEPCKILGISVSKPGKHGAAKARIDAMGLFDGVKRSIVQPVSAKTYVPVVERKSGQVITISGTTVTLMDMKEYNNFEIEVPADKIDQVEVGKEIQYMEALGKRKLDLD
ncbi:MAG: Translation initiation factor 5A [Methanoregulaceae archaeon PtaB.Bin108]|nr:MAG: Translation initiation factor 5A [Methanoregulaceae archaeon PtaB.Bin108]